MQRDKVCSASSKLLKIKQIIYAFDKMLISFSPFSLKIRVDRGRFLLANKKLIQLNNQSVVNHPLRCLIIDEETSSQRYFSKSNFICYNQQYNSERNAIQRFTVESLNHLSTIRPPRYVTYKYLAILIRSKNHIY